MHEVFLNYEEKLLNSTVNEIPWNTTMAFNVNESATTVCMRPNTQNFDILNRDRLNFGERYLPVDHVSAEGKDVKVKLPDTFFVRLLVSRETGAHMLAPYRTLDVIEGDTVGAQKYDEYEVFLVHDDFVSQTSDITDITESFQFTQSDPVYVDIPAITALGDGQESREILSRCSGILLGSNGESAVLACLYGNVLAFASGNDGSVRPLLLDGMTILAVFWRPISGTYFLLVEDKNKEVGFQSLEEENDELKVRK